MNASFRPLIVLCASVLPLAMAMPLAAQETGTTVAVKVESAKAAPLDEYFGAYRMSILGIRNMLRDATLRLERVARDNPESEFGRAQVAESCMRDWESKYPQDSWLPSTILSLHDLYARIDTDQSRKHAYDVGAWLIERFPSSPEAAQIRAESSGFPSS